jgi:hypothetical protein
MPEAVLSDGHRNILLVHHGFVPMTESVKTAPLDIQLIEQWIEFSFADDIRVPRSAVLGRE